MSNVTILIFNALIAFSILVQARLGQIPPALLPSSDEVKQWWEQVRGAGAEAAKAAGQKEEMLKKKRVPQAYVHDDEDELLSKKDREKMNSEITKSVHVTLSTDSSTAEDAEARRGLSKLVFLCVPLRPLRFNVPIPVVPI